MDTAPKTKIIDDYAYEVTQLGFRKGRHTLTRLVRLLGPTLAKTLRNLDGGLDLTKMTVNDVKVSVVATLVGELSESINDDDLDYLCQVFGETTLVSVAPGQYNKLVPLDLANQEMHFKGAYDRFLKWLWFCLEVNYAGFTEGLTSLADRVQSRPARAGESR